MAFDELKKDLMEADTDVRSYLEHSDEYLKLQVFKILMQFLTTSLQTVLVSLGVVFVLLFLSLGASLALCEVLDSYYLGFVLVGGFYVVVSILLYIFRKRWNGPVLRKFSPLYFDGL
ncbi:hypothetical protein [Maribacter halichondriae]|uniref:hypothetical protein n=1 Tax=Maribacter halichondriae TaxID=2980554 RepID=UPI00235A1FAF|nr:hypothetical protein [Maribacter sp. Hal144]